MNFKIFINFFTKYAYSKYVYTILVVLFLRYGYGFTFFSKTVLFEIILALLIYDLPTYLNFKHWEANKIIRYRDLIEIFTSIFSVLYRSYGYIKPVTNVGYYTPENLKDITDKLDNSAVNKEDVDFNLVKLCNKDFQSLQLIHAPYFEEFCSDEDLKEDFLLLTSNIAKIDRDLDLILSLTDLSQQLDCIENFHLQVRNICNEVNIFYSRFFYEIEKNIPMNKSRYMNEVIRGI